jgi:hypothetical protein
MAQTFLHATGPRQYLRTAYGPRSYGFLLYFHRANLPFPGGGGLMLNVNGAGCQFIPSVDFSDAELLQEPVSMKTDLNRTFMTTSVADWDGTGKDQIIACGYGVLFRARVAGELPHPRLEFCGALRDADYGLPFSMPASNASGELADDGGYSDPQFMQNIFTAQYRAPPGSSQVHLIAGDLVGRLWWLEDTSQGTGEPAYGGIQVHKDPDRYRHVKCYQRAEPHYRDFGTDYAQPTALVCDENGEPLLLGEHQYMGQRRLGSMLKPTVFRNPETGLDDLLVVCGLSEVSVIHLQRVNPASEAAPRFRNRGAVEVRDFSSTDRYNSISFWSGLVVKEPQAEVLLSSVFHMVVCKYDLCRGRLRLTYDREICQANTYAGGSVFSEVVVDPSAGRRYLVDCLGTRVCLRQTERRGPDIYIPADRRFVLDGGQPLYVAGGTDPYICDKWGFDKVRQWDFDGSGRQNLIMAADSGRLYLLRERDDTFASDHGFPYDVHGPLVDSAGGVLKAHNRVSVACVDVTGNGLEDLIIGGSTYQAGFVFDDDIGTGIYLVENIGTDAAGLPELLPKQPMDLGGFVLHPRTSTHIELQGVDIDGDGQKEVVACLEQDRYLPRVFRVDGASRQLLSADEFVCDLSAFAVSFLDIDDDGRLEAVFGGDEAGRAWFRRLGPAD